MNGTATTVYCSNSDCSVRIASELSVIFNLNRSLSRLGGLAGFDLSEKLQRI